MADRAVSPTEREDTSFYDNPTPPVVTADDRERYALVPFVAKKPVREVKDFVAKTDEKTLKYRADRRLRD